MESLAWPGIVLVVSLVFIILFRKEIGGLISRIRKLDLPGIKASTEQKPSSTAEGSEKRYEDFKKILDNKIVLEQEKFISDSLKLNDFPNELEKSNFLLRTLSILSLAYEFENTYNEIYGSQIKLLEDINTKVHGEEKTELKKYYDAVATTFPDVYKNYSYDQYLNYLASQKLLLLDNNKVIITVRGREFLSFMVMTGKPKEKLF